MTETGVQWFPRRKTQQQTTRQALDEMLSGRQLAGRDLVTAELARSAALLVDSAVRAQDARMWLSASSRLDALLARLDGDRARLPAGGPASGDADDVAGILGAGPTLGDGSDT